MSINDLLVLKWIKIDKSTIIFSRKTRIWCQLPYPNHPKGCPNYNKNPFCPPMAKYMHNILKKFAIYYLIIAEFNLMKQREKILIKHPSWSIRRANCLLYWQNSIKKQIKKYIENIILKNKKKEIFILSCGTGFKLNISNQEKFCSMEAAGIDVFHTLNNNNVHFELKPINKVILVNLICSNDELLIE